MKRHLALLLAFCAPVACFQELDTGAADNTQPRFDASPAPTTATETPAIELDFKGTRSTTDPCVPTIEQAKAILTANCAGCHGGGPGASQGQFDSVLDFEKLKTLTSAAVKDPRDPSKPMRFLIPGDPEDSRVYQRLFRGEMPPVLPFGVVKDMPRPSFSDVSVLREWIVHCMGASN